MPETDSAHADFATWLRDNATRLDSLDPGASLDDLEPLREIMGDARVVGRRERTLHPGVHPSATVNPVALADLRRAPGGAVRRVERIRSQSAYMETSVADAFDAVLTVPTATVEADLGL